MFVPLFRWFGRIIFRADDKETRKRRDNNKSAMRAERIIAARHGHRQSTNGESEQDDQSTLPLIFCKLADHGHYPRGMRQWDTLIGFYHLRKREWDST